jgi:hypothetical protein
MAHRRFARPQDLGLRRGEFAVLARLRTPQKIQRFLNGVSVNHEVGGETILSVRQVLKQRRAHCIEAAFVAACALWVQGKPPLVMYLDCDPSDCAHVVALFNDHGSWGAISKSRGVGLHFRDPVYRSLTNWRCPISTSTRTRAAAGDTAFAFRCLRHAEHRAGPVGHIERTVRRSPGSFGKLRQYAMISPGRKSRWNLNQ